MRHLRAARRDHRGGRQLRLLRRALPADDHGYLAQVFARVEGMELARSRPASPGASRPSRSSSAPAAARLGLNLGMYVGHSAIRRWVLGDEAYERAATADEVEQLAALVDEAMAAGALGLLLLARPDPPRPRRPAGAEPAGVARRGAGAGRRRRRPGAGSIAYAPGSAVEGIDAADRALLDRARRARRGARHHAGPRRPLQGRRPDPGVGGSRARSSTAPPPAARRSTRC